VGLVILIVIGFLLVPEITRGQNNPAAGTAPTILEPSWETNAPMPTARWGMALASIGNQVYLIAGSTESGITGILERYDSTTNDWEELSPKPEPVTDVHAAVIGGRIYVPGGRTGPGEITSSLEIYDPIADRWDKGQPLPDALSGYAMVTYEGKFLLFGGWDGDGFVDSVYEYIPDQDAWFSATPMPTARGFAGAAPAGGRIYVFGGFDGQNALDVNEVYLPANIGNGEPAWQTADPLPSPRYNMGVASLADIIHVVGGTGEEDTPLPSLQFPALTGEWEIYDSPLIGSWTQMGMGTAGTHIYLIGGELNGSPSTNNLSYQAIYLINLPVIR
jgi:Kelch motif